MNYPWLGCAAAVALSVCLMGAPQAQAVDLKQTSETAKIVISAADRAALLPHSMNGQQAAASITKEQMCSLAVQSAVCARLPTQTVPMYRRHGCSI